MSNVYKHFQTTEHAVISYTEEKSETTVRLTFRVTPSFEYAIDLTRPRGILGTGPIWNFVEGRRSKLVHIALKTGLFGRTVISLEFLEELVQILPRYNRTWTGETTFGQSRRITSPPSADMDELSGNTGGVFRLDGLGLHRLSSYGENQGLGRQEQHIGLTRTSTPIQEDSGSMGMTGREQFSLTTSLDHASDSSTSLNSWTDTQWMSPSRVGLWDGFHALSTSPLTCPLSSGIRTQEKYTSELSDDDLVE